jgi:hypothetical protein
MSSDDHASHPPAQTGDNDPSSPAHANSAEPAVNDSTGDTVDASASAANAAAYNDATVAAVFRAMDTLENVFGFPPHVAQQAIEAVGTDVSAAYNYILDQGLASDQGGPIVPISNCPHVQHHVRLTPDQLGSPHDAQCSHIQQRSTGGAKGDVEEDGSCPSSENWICLHCGVVRCSRYVNAHGVAHYEDTVQSNPGEDKAGHCVGASLTDLSVWCHACKAYLEDPVVQVLVKKLEELKFENEQQQ